MSNGVMSNVVEFPMADRPITESEIDKLLVRDRASSFVLGLAGMQPATTSGVAINVEIKAGYVIDLTDDPRQPGANGGMRIVSPIIYTLPAIDADLD